MIEDQATREQRALLRILLMGKKEIEEGRYTDHDDFFAELEAEFAAQDRERKSSSL